MIIDPLSLKLFVTIVEEGTIARAAEHEHIALAVPLRVGERGSQGLAGGERHGGTLADHALAAHEEGTAGAGDLGGGVAGAVVGHPHDGARQCRGERRQRRRDPLGLVEGRHDDERRGARRSVGRAIYCPDPVVSIGGRRIG